MVLAEVFDTAGDLYEKPLGLDGAVRGVTRSMDFAPYDVLWTGLVLGGRGRIEAGVYGSE
jgi:hypothetical protein